MMLTQAASRSFTTVSAMFSACALFSHVTKTITLSVIVFFGDEHSNQVWNIGLARDHCGRVHLRECPACDGSHWRVGEASESVTNSARRLRHSIRFGTF